MPATRLATSLNLSTLEKTGLLEETDYNKVGRILSMAFDDMRVPAIRQRLRLEPYEFSKYEEYARENFDRQNRPVVDPDMVFDMGVVPITLATPIRACYFPQFMREYEAPDILNQMIIESTDEGYAVLPTNQFMSLIQAGHQVEQIIRAAYAATSLAKDISSTIEVDCEWLLPSTLMLNATDEIRLAVTIFIMCD